MGKMKEVFMQMREDDWQGDPDDYLKQYVNNQRKDYEIHISEILCPNCFRTNLHQVDEHDYHCEVCAYDFIKVNNAIRFK